MSGERCACTSGRFNHFDIPDTTDAEKRLRIGPINDGTAIPITDNKLTDGVCAHSIWTFVAKMRTEQSWEQVVEGWSYNNQSNDTNIVKATHAGNSDYSAAPHVLDRDTADLFYSIPIPNHIAGESVTVVSGDLYYKLDGSGSKVDDYNLSYRTLTDDTITEIDDDDVDITTNTRHTFSNLPVTLPPNTQLILRVRIEAGAGATVYAACRGAVFQYNNGATYY